MKRLLWLAVFTTQFAVAQKLKKADKLILTNLQTHIGYLADDKLEGRRTGTAGEKLAYTYIEKQFKKMNLSPVGDGGGPRRLDLLAHALFPGDRPSGEHVPGTHRGATGRSPAQVHAGLAAAQPVRRRCATDIGEAFFFFPEDDAVTDDMAIRRRRNVLLRLVDSPALGGVDHRVGQELQGILAADVEVDHVVRLIKQDRTMLPGPLLRTPVRKLGRNNRIHISAELRVAEHVHNVSRRLQYLLEVLCRHQCLSHSKKR